MIASIEEAAAAADTAWNLLTGLNAWTTKNQTGGPTDLGYHIGWALEHAAAASDKLDATLAAAEPTANGAPSLTRCGKAARR